jgi:hypothetical protein
MRGDHRFGQDRKLRGRCSEITERRIHGPERGSKLATTRIEEQKNAEVDIQEEHDAEVDI